MCNCFMNGTFKFLGTYCSVLIVIHTVCVEGASATSYQAG